MPAGRRVRLTISRIDPWSVLKFSLLLYVCVYLILMVAGLVLWTAGTVTGLRDNVESFVGDLLSSPDFRFLGGQIFRASLFGGAVMVMVGSALNVLMAVLYNLISDVVGGVRVTLEENAPKPQEAKDDGDKPLRPKSDPDKSDTAKNDAKADPAKAGDAKAEDGGSEPEKVNATSE